MDALVHPIHVSTQALVPRAYHHPGNFREFVFQVLYLVRIGAVRPDDVVLARFGIGSQDGLRFVSPYSLGVIEVGNGEPMRLFGLHPLEGFNKSPVPGIIEANG